jgi:predicted phage-related endonuclease
MKITSTIITHAQGSEGWDQHRKRSYNASELAVAMGISSNMKRDDLVRCKATGIPFEHSDFVEKRVFAPGHEYEALARPLAQEDMGEELYPCVMAAEVEGLPLSASLDGLDLMGDMTWEHKQASDVLIASLEAGVIPDEYHPQMEQGLLLSGAKRCMFSASKGTRESMRSVWYESNPELRAKIIPTWKQFMADVAAYVPVEVIDKPVAAPVTALPAVSVQVTGEIAVRDNFALFETALRDFIDNRLIREPATDQEFADLDLQIKALKNAESALDAAEAQMLAQVSTVDTIKRTKDMLHKLARDNRLMAEKLLDARKLAIKGEIVAGGVAALAKHIRELNAAMPGDYMPVVPADFGGAVKGKRTVESLRDAVNTELARAKIAANEIATRIGVNIKHLQENAGAHKFLFMDTATIVLKQPDDLQALVANRINEHQRQEAAKEEAQRERIRAEEAARLQREADEKRRAEEAEAQRKARAEQEEADRLEREEYRRRGEEAAAQREAQAAIAVAATPAPEVKTYDNGAPMFSTTTFKDNGEPIMLTPEGKRSVFCDIADDDAPEKPAPARVSPAIPTDSGARLTLGQINERLEVVSVNTEQLARMGFTATVNRSARTYLESDFPRMCAVIQRHLIAVSQGVAA